MARCADVAGFLEQVGNRSVSGTLPPPDMNALQDLNLVQVMTPDQYHQLEQTVAGLQQAQADLAAVAQQRAAEAGSLAVDTRKSHSILFHLKGVDQQHATLERLQQEQAALQQIDADLQRRQQAFAQLLVSKATLDTACAFDGGFVALTTAGRMALRDLTVRLYRVGDEPFPAYWEEAKRVDSELLDLASQSGTMQPPLATSLPDVDRSYLWAIAIGLAKVGRDPATMVDRFVRAYRNVEPLSPNPENRLMSAEVLSVLPEDLDQGVESLEALIQEVETLGVPEAAALGVSAILLLGRRADGTFPTDHLVRFLTATPSLESAALLAIDNRPEVIDRFSWVKGLFASWGYPVSEDTELSSAYLALTDLPTETVAPKMAIITRGLGGYLQYPLVASGILASIPVLEANETLNLMEKAYEIIGQRTGPMPQPELICLAVRMAHGVRVATVDELDSTAKVPTAAPGFSYADAPTRLWAPVFVTHGIYYSTFSGIGGAHPGHVHSWGGGGWGGGGGFVG